MKILLTALTFFVVVSGKSANAQSRITGGVYIIGEIPSEYSVRITPETAATQLAIQKGETETKVASVIESVNSSSGYSILISTQNGGMLVNDSNTKSAIPYQLSYDGLPATQPSTSAKPVKVVSALPDPIVHESQIRITFRGQANAPVGTYGDTIFLQISAP